VSPDLTTEDLIFPFEVARIESPWTGIQDAVTGRQLQFRVVVVRSGFLKALEGRTSDGTPWPHAWKFDPESRVDSEQRLVLPSLERSQEQRMLALDKLEQWLGRALPRLEAFPPASNARLAARESALLGTFPLSLRAFFQITDGIESPLLRVLGHADVYAVDNRHLPALLVAWDGDDRDDFLVVVSLAGSDERVYRLDVHSDDPEPEAIADDFRLYLSARLGIGVAT
jgi:hypothetical protein